MARCNNLARIAGILIFCCTAIHAHALGGPRYVTTTPEAGSLPLIQNHTALPLLVNTADWPGVVRAAGDLSDDIKRVTDTQPAHPEGPRRTSHHRCHPDRHNRQKPAHRRPYPTA